MAWLTEAVQEPRNILECFVDCVHLCFSACLYLSEVHEINHLTQ